MVTVSFHDKRDLAMKPGNGAFRSGKQQ